MTDREPTLAEQIAALKRVINLHGPCDHFDHHGNCQTHFVENPCSVAALPSILASLQAIEQADGMDAKRWRKARRILAVEDIESAARAMRETGSVSTEEENLKADAAIDAEIAKERGG